MKTLKNLCMAICMAMLPLACLEAAPAADTGSATIPDQLELFSGEARVLPLSPGRIAIGDGKVISASAVAANQLLILAEKPGNSTLHLWLKDGTQRELTVRVLEADLKRTLDDVNRLLSSVENVHARIAGSRIVLEGEMVSDSNQERAQAIQKMYPDQVVNFIGKVGWEQMVHLDVKVVELTKRGARDLGIAWDSAINGPAAGLIADIASNKTFRYIPDPARSGIDMSGITTNVWPPKGFITLASAITSRINLLVQDGDAQMLAAPSLSTRSGSKARFIAGGEIPLPVQNTLGALAVQFKEYGIILEVTPVTDKSGAIYAKVDIEVSSIDRAVTVQGIPGILKRRSSAEFNSRDGETVVLNGLYAYEATGDNQKVPGLGDVPLLGGLFRNKQSEQSQRDVAILITPRLVRATPGALDPEDLNKDKLQDIEHKMHEHQLGATPRARLSVTE
ncbi:type II and III secretion system protein family protein [Oxalobacteraceae bacterium A2-2]